MINGLFMLQVYCFRRLHQQHGTQCLQHQQDPTKSGRREGSQRVRQGRQRLQPVRHLRRVFSRRRRCQPRGQPVRQPARGLARVPASPADAPGGGCVGVPALSEPLLPSPWPRVLGLVREGCNKPGANAIKLFFVPHWCS